MFNLMSGFGALFGDLVLKSENRTLKLGRNERRHFMITKSRHSASNNSFLNSGRESLGKRKICNYLYFVGLCGFMFYYFNDI